MLHLSPPVAVRKTSSPTERETCEGRAEPQEHLRREVKGGPYAYRQKPVGCLYIGTEGTAGASDQLADQSVERLAGYRQPIAHSSGGVCAAAQDADIETYGQKSLREENTVIKVERKRPQSPRRFNIPLQVSPSFPKELSRWYNQRTGQNLSFIAATNYRRAPLEPSEGD